MKKIDTARYASELLFHAAVAAPWEVSEAEFIAIASMLTDEETKLTSGERDDVGQFLAIAFEAAASADCNAADISEVYRRCCQAVKRRGGTVHADGAVSPL